MKSRKIIGILLCSVIILSGSAMVFAGDNEEKAAITPDNICVNSDVPEKSNKEEPLAGLKVITDEEEISRITLENPEIKKYLEQNEPFAELEIITDQSEIKKIWEENPDVKALMQSETHYYLAYVKGTGVRLRNLPSTSAAINGLLYETENDWVLLNDNYSLNEKYLWWEVEDSSIGFSGLINTFPICRTIE